MNLHVVIKTGYFYFSGSRNDFPLSVNPLAATFFLLNQRKTERKSQQSNKERKGERKKDTEPEKKKKTEEERPKPSERGRREGREKVF